MTGSRWESGGGGKFVPILRRKKKRYAKNGDFAGTNTQHVSLCFTPDKKGHKGTRFSFLGRDWGPALSTKEAGELEKGGLYFEENGQTGSTKYYGTHTTRGGGRKKKCTTGGTD